MVGETASMQAPCCAAANIARRPESTPVSVVKLLWDSAAEEFQRGQRRGRPGRAALRPMLGVPQRGDAIAREAPAEHPFAVQLEALAIDPYPPVHLCFRCKDVGALQRIAQRRGE